MEQQDLTGIIFNIQKFSLNDGPGIRTNVFFKGCPLRCRWCANPESQKPEVERLGDEEKGIAMTVEEIIRICLQDKDFYEESQGGVTLTGGEVLAQPDFATALLMTLKKEGLHTAMETSGFASPATFRKVTQYVDLLLFDLKHWSTEKHLEGTGVSNELPLQNMAWAIQQGKEVLPRIPVIPGFNDSPEDALEMARTLKAVGAAKAQLLPFHQFGQNKYHQLGREYAYETTPSLHPEDLADYLQIMQDNGIAAFC